MKSVIKSMVKQSLKGGGYMAGDYIGRSVPMPGASASLARMGSKMGAKLSKLIGSGDYAVSDAVESNSLFASSSSRAHNVASFETKAGGVRIRHREFVQDLFVGPVAGAFTNAHFAVNPGLANVFPYLAQIAANYEQYKFHGLVFEFVSSTAPYGVTAMGTYVMAMEYNAAAAAFLTKAQIENSDYALSARIDKSGMYGVECAPGQQALEYYFTRASAQGQPIQLTDLGLFQFALAPGVGLAANSVIGELWVTYDVELIRPRISLSRYGYYRDSNANAAAAQPLGNSASQSLVSYGSLTGITQTGGTTLNLAGIGVDDVIMVTFNWYAGAGVACVSPSITLTNCAYFQVYGNGTANSVNAPNSTVNSVYLIVSFFVKVTSTVAVPTIVLGTGGTIPVGSIDIVIVDVGNGYGAGQL